MSLRRVTNHPVHLVDHLVDEEGNHSPSALIPFCEFSGNMSIMGVKIDQFDVPVCNSFRPKFSGDQLCFEVDPNYYKDKIDADKKLSLSLFIDYNEDRHMFLNGSEKDIDDDFYIKVETIGKM